MTVARLAFYLQGDGVICVKPDDSSAPYVCVTLHWLRPKVSHRIRAFASALWFEEHQFSAFLSLPSLLPSYFHSRFSFLHFFHSFIKKKLKLHRWLLNPQQRFTHFSLLWFHTHVHLLFVVSSLCVHQSGFHLCCVISPPFSPPSFVFVRISLLQLFLSLLLLSSRVMISLCLCPASVCGHATEPVRVPHPAQPWANITSTPRSLLTSDSDPVKITASSLLGSISNQLIDWLIDRKLHSSCFDMMNIPFLLRFAYSWLCNVIWIVD